MTTEYRSADGANWSSLKHIDVSPLHYRHRLDHPTASTAAMKAGTLAHLLTLEPERFAESIVVPPDDVLGKGGRRSTKAYREWADAQPDDVTIATADEVDAAQAIAAAVHAHPVAGALLAEARCEVPMYWQDAATGLGCKGMADAIVDEPTDGLCMTLGVGGGPILADLKTTSDLAGFARHAARYGYHGQMAHYAAGVEALTGHAPLVYIVAVESSAPHDVAVYRVSGGAMLRGMAYRDRLLRRLADCIERDEWPGVAADVLDLDVPEWAS